MNANPSGSRTPWTGCLGSSKARREFTATTGPSQGLAQRDVCAGLSGQAIRRGAGSNGGSRHAKTVCRGALNLRRTAQGRVGGDRVPRHVAIHLVSHRLLSARTSAPADAVRPYLRDGASPRLMQAKTVRKAASCPQAQPGECRTTRDGSCGRELVHPGPDVTPASARAQSRGKGVLAA